MMQVFLMCFAYLNESSYRRESLSTDGCCWIAGQWIEGTETASFDKQKAGVSWPSLCENRNVAFSIGRYEGKILWMVANSCTTKRMVEAQQNHGMFTTYQLVGFSSPILKAPCTSILVDEKIQTEGQLAEGCVPLPGSATPGRTAQKLIVGNRLP